MRRWGLFIKCLLILSIIIICPGCWNYKEVENFSVVAGVAMDKNSDPEMKGKYLMTLEIVDTSGGRDKSEMGAKLFSLTGDTIFDIDRNLISVTGSRVFWSHAKVLIVSREIAEEGLDKIIDWYNRDNELRSNMYLLMSREKTANELLRPEGKSSPVISFKINKLLQSEDDINTAYPAEIWDFIGDLESPITTASMPIVFNHKEADGTITRRVSGQAVLERGKLAGVLTGEESKMAAMIKDELRGGVFGFVEGESGKSFVLEVMTNKTRLKPGVVDGKPSMQIITRTETNLDEVNGYEDFSKPEIEKKLKEFAEKELEKRMMAVINKVQKQYKTDVFAFGQKFYEDKPKLWKQYKDQWREIYPTMNVNVTCHIDISSSAKTIEPVKVGE